MSSSITGAITAARSRILKPLESSKSVSVICAKNIGLFSIAGIMFWLVGYNLAYGIPEGGYIGTIIPWSDSSAIETGYSDSSDWFFQTMFVCATVSIVSGAVAERIKIWPFFLFCAILAGVIYPIEPEKTPLLTHSYSSIKLIALIFGAPVIEPIGKVVSRTSVKCVLGCTSEDIVDII